MTQSPWSAAEPLVPYGPESTGEPVGVASHRERSQAEAGRRGAVGDSRIPSAILGALPCPLGGRNVVPHTAWFGQMSRQTGPRLQGFFAAVSAVYS